MTEVINLRLARKARLRDDKEKLAAANRAKFGQTGAARTASDRERARQTRLLDGHERDNH